MQFISFHFCRREHTVKQSSRFCLLIYGVWAGKFCQESFKYGKKNFTFMFSISDLRFGF